MNKKIKALLSVVMVIALCLMSVALASCGDKGKDQKNPVINTAFEMAQEICKAAGVVGKDLGYLPTEIYDVQTTTVGGWWITAKEHGGIQSVTLCGSKDGQAIFYSRVFSFPDNASAAAFVKAIKDHSSESVEYAEVQGVNTIAAGKFAVISKHYHDYNHANDAFILEFAEFVKTQLEKLA